MALEIQAPQLQIPIAHTAKGEKVLAEFAFNQMLEQIVQATQGFDDGTGLITITLGPIILFYGSGDPNGVVVGSPPNLYLNASGGAGTTLYVKESGAATDTGWVGK